MKLNWTNTEWDNFSGVASQDNLLMLNAGDDFLNAGGQGGNDNVDKYSYTGDEANVTRDLTEYQILPSERFSTAKDLAFVESKLSFFTEQANSARNKRNQYNVRTAGYAIGSNDKKNREGANKKLWGWDRMEARTKEIRDTLIAQIAKAKADGVAQAKADADAKAKAKEDADAKAKADADKAKMKTLTDQLIIAKTPEERARIQAEIDALAGNVAKATGSSKLIIYGVVGLAIIGGAYMLLRRK